MSPATILREWLTSQPLGRCPERDPVMDSDDAVSAYVRAGQPGGILSGVYAFNVDQACKMTRPGNLVLDLGCGPASLLADIAALNPDSRFVGIDRSAAMIAAGQSRIRATGLRNIDVRLDDMTQLCSVEAGSVDVVLSSMALHHLPDGDHLHRCFEAIERVMAPGARMFVCDFGRLNSVKSIEYFVRRAIPSSESVLERDYRASLRAAFSPEEFDRALSGTLRRRVSIYTTIASAVMVVVMTPFASGVPRAATGHIRPALKTLPYNRRADYWQLCLALRLGGMPFK